MSESMLPGGDAVPKASDPIDAALALAFRPRAASPADAGLAPPSGPTVPALRYQLHEEIGRGGMGVVWRGQDRDLERELVFKVLRAEYRQVPEVVERFVQEARIGGQLQHPGVVPVHELGRLPDGCPYFTMKLVRGHTLAELLRNPPAELRLQTLPRFIDLFEQVCQTMAYAHDKGVIHGDLKPANIMVGAFGEVQVMDWGLAQRRQADGATISGPGAIVAGTPPYMPPEQALGRGVDERCDVFGLGAILCEILTGLPPYVGGASASAFEKAKTADLDEALARLEQCAADAELIALAKACLDGERLRRPAHAGEVAERVATYRAGVQERLRTADLARTAAEVQAKEERKRRRLVAARAASALVVLLGGCGLLLNAEHDRALRVADSVRREAQTEQRLLLELEDARVLDQGRLDEARAAAARVEALLEGASEGLRRRLAPRLADLNTLARLEDVRLHTLDVKADGFDHARAAAQYAAAFRSYGIDVTTLESSEAAARIRRRPIRAHLIAILDDWARRTADVALQRRLWQIAAEAEAEPTGLANRVRLALVQAGAAPLVRLAREVHDARRLPATTLLSLGVALRQRGALDEAIQVLRAGQQRYPGDFWLNLELGTALMLHWPARPTDALPYFTAALALSGGNPGVQVYLGNALVRAGKLAEAEAAFREALRLKPDLVVAHINLGYVLNELKRPAEAEASFRRALEYDPRNALAYYNLGLALQRQHKNADAVAAYRQAVACKPDYAEAFNNLGNALTALRRFAEAETAFRQALLLRPRYARAAFNLAWLLEEQKRMDEAEVAYRQAIESNPGYFEARCNLAEILARQRRHAAAARLSQEAFVRNPGRADNLATGDRYRAATAAARAGCGLGVEALADRERVVWRKQALSWLRADLARRVAQADSGDPRQLRDVRGNLPFWKRDDNLACVRDPQALARLPQAERLAWQRFWAEVEALLVRIEAGK
jgi:serine/threonine-protein kinase